MAAFNFAKACWTMGAAISLTKNTNIELPVSIQLQGDIGRVKISIQRKRISQRLGINLPAKRNSAILKGEKHRTTQPMAGKMEHEIQEIIEEQDENMDKSEPYRAPCNTCNCNIKTDHTILKSIRGIRYYENEPYVHWDELHQIIQCCGCKSISFRIWSRYSDDRDNENELFYPERCKRQKKQYSELPENIQRIYTETIACFNNKCYMLCAAGVRAIIDGTCNNKLATDDHNANTKINDMTLYKKISALKTNHTINKEQEDALHQCRLLGNEALHELEMITEQELTLAIDIVEGLLDHMYVQPENAAKLRLENESRKNRL